MQVFNRMEGDSLSSVMAQVDIETVAALWVKVYHHLSQPEIISGLAVCKCFRRELPVLVTTLELTHTVPQHQLKFISTALPHLNDLTIRLKYDDNTVPLDFSNLSFPSLKKIWLYCCPLATLNFTIHNTPKLQSLSMDTQGPHSLHNFNLNLPDLTSLYFDFVNVNDPAGFGPSLSNCPKLARFQCYKLWGLGGMVHHVNLPACSSFGVYRSDDLEGLELTAPRLTSLSLRACYSLDHLRLMPEEGPPVRVNITNANIGRKSLRLLRQHLRVGSTRITEQEDEELMMW